MPSADGALVGGAGEPNDSQPVLLLLRTKILDSEVAASSHPVLVALRMRKPLVVAASIHPLLYWLRMYNLDIYGTTQILPAPTAPGSELCTYTFAGLRLPE